MRFQGRVTIDRSVREVFAFVSRPEHLHLWASGVSGAERTRPGPMGVGATFEVLGEGKAHKECWEVIEHEPPRAFAYRRLDWGAFLQFRYALRGVDGCTDLGLEVYSGMGTSPDPSSVLEQEAERQLEADLGRLRAVLESGVDKDGMREGDVADSDREFGAADGVAQHLGTRDGHGWAGRTQSVTVLPVVGSRRRVSPRSKPTEPG